MPVYFKNTSHDIVFGESPIEKMGGNKLTFSMYGENIPVVLEDGENIIKIRYDDYNLIYLTDKGNRALHYSLATKDPELQDPKYKHTLLMALNTWDIPSICVFHPKETVQILN